MSETVAVDTDAEAVVISAMVLAPETVDELPFLEPRHFYSTANQNIVQAIHDLHQRGQQIDLTAISTRMRETNTLQKSGGVPYLAQVCDATPAVAHVEQHARTVVDRWRQRTLVATCRRFAVEGAAPTDDIASVIDQASQSLEELSIGHQEVTLEHVSQVLGDEIQKRREAHENDTDDAPVTLTGLRDLDDLIGGLVASDLYIVAGRPGQGKTALAVTMACNVAKPRFKGSELLEAGGAVALFSCEMPREQIALRMVCNQYAINAGDLRKSWFDGEGLDQVERAQQDFLWYPIWIDDTPAVSVAKVRSRVRKLKRELARTSNVPNKGLKLVVVDYLQLMTGRRSKGDSREQEVASLTRDLKQLAKQENVAVLALSQLNRAVEKSGKKEKKPSLPDLRESGAIEQDADCVMFVYRESYYSPDAPKLAAEIIVGKQRNGPTKTIQVIFQGEYMRFLNKAERYTSDEYGDFSDSL